MTLSMSSESARRARRRVVAAGIAGNVMEWYDFAVYGYFARTIGNLYFPVGDRQREAAGRLRRLCCRLPHAAHRRHPVRLYRRSRRPRPLAALVGGPDGGTHLLHRAFAQLRPDRPCRTGADDSLPSAAGPGRGRGIYRLRRIPGRDRPSQPARFRRRLGAVRRHQRHPAGFAGRRHRVNLLPLEDVVAWGWRVPFLLGVVVGGVGFILRRRMPHDKPAAAKGFPLFAALRDHPRQMLQVVGLSMINAAVFYILFVYIVAWLNSIGGAFLAGSFGSGKSHFMAVLYALLRHNPAARAKAELQPVIARHDDVLREQKVLPLAFHLLGAESMEQALFAGYIRQIARAAPGRAAAGGARVGCDPGRCRAAAERRRGRAVLRRAERRCGGGRDDPWAALLGTGTWTAETYDAARAAAPAASSASCW